MVSLSCRSRAPDPDQHCARRLHHLQRGPLAILGSVDLDLAPVPGRLEEEPTEKASAGIVHLDEMHLAGPIVYRQVDLHGSGQRLPSERRLAISAKVVSPSRPIPWRNMPSIACAASGRLRSMASATAGHLSSGMPASTNGFHTSCMN